MLKEPDFRSCIKRVHTIRRKPSYLDENLPVHQVSAERTKSSPRKTSLKRQSSIKKQVSLRKQATLKSARLQEEFE
jgi:hypothetical protein